MRYERVQSYGISRRLPASCFVFFWFFVFGLVFLAWYVFAPQCASTIGVVKRETNSWLWPAVMLVYMTALAYLAALVTYQVAKAFGLG